MRQMNPKLPIEDMPEGAAVPIGKIIGEYAENGKVSS